jgi:hypothetical protein
VHWAEQTYGRGDNTTSAATFQLQRSAPQMDGSVVYLGQGQVDIVFRPGGGCTATRGANTTMPMMIIVTSDDGQTAIVDIGISYMGADPLGDAREAGTFPVEVTCPSIVHTSERDVTVSAPPSVELPLRDGATANYDDSSRSGYLGGQLGGERGMVRLEFC